MAILTYFDLRSNKKLAEKEGILPQVGQRLKIRNGFYEIASIVCCFYEYEAYEVYVLSARSYK